MIRWSVDPSRCFETLTDPESEQLLGDSKIRRRSISMSPPTVRSTTFQPFLISTEEPFPSFFPPLWLQTTLIFYSEHRAEANPPRWPATAAETNLTCATELDWYLRCLCSAPHIRTNRTWEIFSVKNKSLIQNVIDVSHASPSPPFVCLGGFLNAKTKHIPEHTYSSSSRDVVK